MKMTQKKIDHYMMWTAITVAVIIFILCLIGVFIGNWAVQVFAIVGLLMFGILGLAFGMAMLQQWYTKLPKS